MDARDIYVELTNYGDWPCPGLGRVLLKQRLESKGLFRGAYEGSMKGAASFAESSE